MQIKLLYTSCDSAGLLQSRGIYVSVALEKQELLFISDGTFNLSVWVPRNSMWEKYKNGV